MKTGDIVTFKSVSSPGAKGYDSFPGEHGFHKALWTQERIGIIIETRDTFHLVLVGKETMWFDEDKLTVIK